MQVGDTIIQSDSITVKDLIISGELDISGNLIVGNESDSTVFLDVCGTLLVNSGNNNMFINNSINPSTNKLTGQVGFDNIGIGNNSMSVAVGLDQSANMNIGIGKNSMANFRFGVHNTALGAESLTNYIGSNANYAVGNTAIGAGAMHNFIGNLQEKDSFNTAIGAYSLYNLINDCI